MFLGLLTGSHRPAFEAHPCAPVSEPFHPSRIAGLGTARFMGLSASRNTFFSVHDHGLQRSVRGPQHTFLPMRWPDCTLSRLRGGIRPAGDPVDNDPATVFKDDLHPGSDAGRPLEPRVYRRTWEPTVMSRVSCRPAPEYRPFSPALPVTLGALLTSTETRLAWAKFGEDLPLRAARLFLLVRLTGVDGTTAGCN